jgi:hypothetical protein
MRPFINHLELPLMQRLATLLDALLTRTAHLLPGVVSGGVFFRPQQALRHFDRWTERGAYVVQVGRLEVILDRGDA